MADTRFGRTVYLGQSYMTGLFSPLFLFIFNWACLPGFFLSACSVPLRPFCFSIRVSHNHHASFAPPSFFIFQLRHSYNKQITMRAACLVFLLVATVAGDTILRGEEHLIPARPPVADRAASAQQNKPDCYKDSDCHKGRCNAGTCLPDPLEIPSQKRAATAQQNKPDCYKDADCHKGRCNAGTCLPDPQKRAATAQQNKPDCYKDADCHKGKCNAGTCLPDPLEIPSQKRAATAQQNKPDCYKDTDCHKGKCNAGTCLSNPL